MTLPNFFIVGMGRCGTTSLYRYLKQHPDIFMSPVKEPHFFSFRGKKFTGQKPKKRPRITTLEEYELLFRNAEGYRRVGEASPSYLHYEGTAERIKEAVPHAKIIIMLRNPADRAFSSYLHCRRKKYEPLDTFEEALEVEEQRKRDGYAPSRQYKGRGFYYNGVKKYLDVFGPENVKIYLTEDMEHHGREFIQSVFRFLEVRDDFIPDMSRRFGTSMKAGRLNRIQRFFRRLGLYRPRVPAKPAMPEAARRQLLEGYRDDIARLQTLLGRDLSHWLT